MRIDRVSASLLGFVGLYALAAALKGFWMPTQAWAFWLCDLAYFVMVPLLAWRWVKRVFASEASTVGASTDHVDAQLAWVALIVVLAVVTAVSAAQLSNRLMHHVPVDLPEISYRAMLKEAGISKVYGALYLAATAALAEEFVYRVLCWRIAERLHAPTWAYVLSTSLLFTLIHTTTSPQALLLALGFGLWAALVYAKYQSFWSIVLAHLLIDLYTFGWL